MTPEVKDIIEALIEALDRRYRREEDFGTVSIPEAINPDDLALLDKYKQRFTVDYGGTPYIDGNYGVVDVNAAPVAKFRDPKMAALVARLLTEFWRSSRRLAVDE